MPDLSEIITEIHVSSRPLRRHVYSYSGLSQREEGKKPRGATGLLLDAVNTRIEKEEEILRASGLLTDEPEKKPKIRKISKPRFTIFDYSEIEQEELSQEVNDLINRDHYYDDIVPIDEGNEGEDRSKSKGLFIILAAVAIAITVFVLFVKWIL